MSPVVSRKAKKILHQDKTRNSTLNTLQPAAEFFLSTGNSVYLGLGLEYAATFMLKLRTCTNIELIAIAISFLS